MKFSLIITDMTEEDVSSLMSKIQEQEVQVNTEAKLGPQQTVVDHTEAVQTIVETAEEQLETSDDFDAMGLPWDERIHSSNKKKTSKGVWTRRRGVQDVTFNEIVQELRDGGKHAVAVTSPPVVKEPIDVPQPTPGTVQPVNVTPPLPVAQPQPAPGRDFEGFLNQVNSLFANAKIDADYLPSVVERINGDFPDFQINTITDIANNNDLVDYAWQCLVVDGKVAA